MATDRGGATPDLTHFWRHGIDPKLFGRVYKNAAILGSILTLMLLGVEQAPSAAGLAVGTGIGIVTLWTVEWTVKLLFNGGQAAGMKLALGACVKLPLMLPVMLAVAWGSYHRHLNVFTVVGGMLFVHITLLALVLNYALNPTPDRK